MKHAPFADTPRRRAFREAQAAADARETRLAEALRRIGDIDQHPSGYIAREALKDERA